MLRIDHCMQFDLVIEQETSPVISNYFNVRCAYE